MCVTGLVTCLLVCYLLTQEIVNYTSPVEAFVTRIKNLDRSKSSLIAWLFPSDFRGVKGQERCHTFLVSETMSWYYNVLVLPSSSWSLDQFLKRMLIAWFYFDPCRKCFNRRHVCDHPLLRPTSYTLPSSQHLQTLITCAYRLCLLIAQVH